MTKRAVVFLALLVTRSLSAAAQEDLLPPQIVHEPCDFYQKNKPFRVVARFYDDSAVFDPKVIYRSAKIKNWRSVSFQKAEGSDEFVARIRARHLRGTLEYFIETFDENGNGPARYGSPEAPMRLRPSARATDCLQVPEAPEVVTQVESSQPTAPASPVVDTTPKKGEPTGEGSSAAAGEAPRRSGSEPAAPIAPDEPAATPAPAETIAATPDSESGRAEDGEAEGAPAPSQAETTALTAEVPPPAKTGCAAPRPPVYCSPLLWTLVGVGVAGATTGGVLAWCFAGGPCQGGNAQGDQVTIEVGSGDLDGAFGLR